VTVEEVPAVLPDHVPSTTAADALAQLSAEHRAVLWRSYYLGWTVARIAEDLQIAEGTVKSRLHYALRALRRTLLHGREPDGG
jgi:RNA polymerase sigma factor (sigma-70 family)